MIMFGFVAIELKSKERDILIEGAIYGASKKPGTREIPRNPQDEPSLDAKQQWRWCLNWPYPVVRMMTTLNVIIEPSSNN